MDTLLGTYLHGIGSTTDLDSSGERVKIEGIDISSATQDGTINFEHKSEEPSQIVGKILEVKKILKKDDCENEHHEYFWKKAGERPYLYVAGVLFDKFNHPGAISIAAMLKFDQLTDKKNTKHVVNFSIEGSRLDKKGIWIEKCIMRKITVTTAACNKMCIAELLEKPSKTKLISKESLFDIFKKCEEVESNLNKSDTQPKFKSKLSFKLKPTISPKENFKPLTPMSTPAKEGKPIIPKRTISSQSNKEWKLGDRIVPSKTTKPKTGKDIYSNPNTWKSEGKKKKFYMSNIQKALIASCSDSAPSNLTGMSALTKECFGKKQLDKIFKTLSDSAFERLDKKEDLVKFISEKLPKLNENEVLAIAKAVAYIKEKKNELKLSEMIKE
ncbi:MAG TPA: hypothetical protein VI911_11825 [Patescibacteria group bacterium]|nr:hypothetical protein [Patescibacteria group bacterium]